MLDMIGRISCANFILHPIFIVGGSRSGTIVLLKAMGRHEEIISTPSENPFITDIGGMVHALEYCSESERNYYLQTLRVRHEYIYADLRRLAIETSFGPHYGIKNLIKHVVQRKKNIMRKRYWCTKTFPSKKVAHGLLKLYPDAKFLWILRNGVNVVYSRCRFPAFRDLTFEEHCHHWADSIRRFSYIKELPDSAVVRQEELLDDPDQVFGHVFDVFGIRFDSKSAEYAKTHHVHPLSDESTIKGVDIKKTITQRQPAHMDWSTDQKNIFKEICSESMRIAGYRLEF